MAEDGKGAKPPVGPTGDGGDPTRDPIDRPLVATMVPPAGATVATLAPPPIPTDWRYELGPEIARGGMGRVVEATDTVLGRTVAVKEALSGEPDAVRRFHRETRITARLEHPSIVPVHDAGLSPSGAPFYVMRKISGRPLEELVAHAETLAERLALLPHVVAAAHAVAHAHARGIVHRDIKPSNILVGDLGETIMIDWGLAKAIGEADELHPEAARIDNSSLTTRAGVVFGTPGFISPEQLRGGQADERSDVYALGATLYYLLARRPTHFGSIDDDSAAIAKAAVEGPPRSIGAVVHGVAPELATIVDKALAHDPAARYRNAGALAEDLQRFLTGQLVASHHYSPRERVLRLVRHNRALVGVGGAAIVAMAIGAWIAIGRIVDARDRADAQARIALTERRSAEDQKDKVTDSLQQLTLTQARSYAELDPTRAVALTKSVAMAKWWRKARAIGAAARDHGVAFSMPASPHTLSLEAAHDGQHVLAAGDDGIVRIYDLAHRTFRVISDAKAPVTARFADGERTIVVFHGDHLTLVDASDGHHRDVTAPTAIAKLEVSGPIAYWVDPAGAVWSLDVAAGAPVKLALAEPVKAVVPSPDGRWIALAGSAHLLLLDRTHPTLPPEAPADGDTRAVAWGADASHVVALIDQEIVDIAMMPSPTVAHRQIAGNRHAVAYSGGHVFSTGPTGVARDDARSRRLAGGYTLELREARAGVVVTGDPQGVIAILSDDGDQLVQSPLPRISHIEASSHTPWVVASVDGLVLVWNLDAIEPRHVTPSPPSGAAFVTGDQLVVASIDSDAQWIDLQTGKATSLGMIPGLTAVVPAPDRQHAVIIDGTHHARLAAAVGAPVELAGDIELAAFADDRHLAVATSTGDVRVDDRVLAHRPAGVVALGAAPGWVAAAFGDRTLWRMRLGGGEAVLALSAAPPRSGFVLAPDGTVVFAAGGELRAWRPDGGVTTLATFAKPIAKLSGAGPERVLVISDGAAALVGTERPGDLEATEVPISPTASIASDSALIASVTPAGVLELVDPVAKEHWTLRGPAFSFTQLSPDGRRVLAATPAGLLVWTVELPQTADETMRWLDDTTNATINPIDERGPSAPLGWR